MKENRSRKLVAASEEHPASSSSSETTIPDLPILQNHSEPQHPLPVLTRLGDRKEPQRTITIQKTIKKKTTTRLPGKKRGGSSPLIGASLKKRNVNRSSIPAKKKLNMELSHETNVSISVPRHCKYLRFEGSDHRPLLTFLDETRVKKKGMFRFDNRLRDKEEVFDLITQVWGNEDTDTVETKISRCQSELTRWSREQNQNSAQVIKEALKSALLKDIPEPNPETLFSRVMIGKYCHKSSFLQSTPPANASHGWRGIIAGRRILTKGLGWLIGNGESIRVWDDPWLSSSEPVIPYGPRPRHIAELRVSDLIDHHTHSWKWDLIRLHLPMYEPHIRLLMLGFTSHNDSMAWLLTKNGEYTTRSGYSTRVSEAATTQDRAFN
ncbi:unnamed protein product [Arabis nemorensis]|uniref:Uncharacterized protein n=1 Tax=Arabis nemorensis TaxID=586526 RepID=A0A565BUK2_9BRAS|nr:unnamed protein product [Arabis nemorensis]